METQLSETPAYTSGKAKWSLALALITIAASVRVGSAANDTGGLSSALAQLPRVIVLDAGIIAAVILGHLALAEIRKSAGSVKGKPLTIVTLVLSYCCVLVFGFFTAFSIHDVITRRLAENEYSAISIVRDIVLAQKEARIMNRATNCDLAELGKQGFLDVAKASGARHGYSFKLSCEKSVDGSATEPQYQVLATPTKPGETGERVFCSDSSGRVHFVPDSKSPCDSSSSKVVESR